MINSLISSTGLHTFADQVALPTVHDNSLITWCVVGGSLLLNLLTLWRSIGTDKRAAKRDEFTAVVEEYKQLYERAEKIIKEQSEVIGELKRTIIEQEKVIKQQREQIGELKTKLKISDETSARLQVLLAGYEKTTVTTETVAPPIN